MTVQLPPPCFIDTTRALIDFVDSARPALLLGVDTEANSLFAYQEQVCLIQISVSFDPDSLDIPTDYIIDPIAIDDMRSLGELFANPNTELIFHAADYDIMGLKRDFDFQFARVFDTYIGARMLGWKHLGLSTLLEKYFGIQHSKKYQKANWHKRPLTQAQLDYARIDTHYLVRLRQIILSELKRAKREKQARRKFATLIDLPAARKVFDPEGFIYFKGIGNLGTDQLEILQSLYLWREKKAQKLNLPPFRVVQNEVLVNIATMMPQTINELTTIKGIPRETFQHDARTLLQIVTNHLKNGGFNRFDD